MCFSTTVNFAGSAALGAAGMATLAKVKHRLELLFAAMPLLFAIYQFIAGFVWPGLAPSAISIDEGKKRLPLFPWYEDSASHEYDSPRTHSVSRCRITYGLMRCRLWKIR